MKAVIVNAFGPIEQAQVTQAPDPQPVASEVIIDVHAIDVNYPDILVMEGNYQNKPPLPFSPGKAATGIVTCVGENVTSFKQGDRVAVQVEYGAYAEKLAAPATTCYPLPDNVSFVDGAALGLVFQTAWFALNDRAGFSEGDVVLVLGASGGIGVASMQLAKALGAGKVIAGVRGDAKTKFVRSAGADEVIDLNMDDLRNGLKTAVANITDGRGADIVIDPVGGDSNAAALRAMAWCGRMVIVGFAAGTIPVIKTNYLLVKNLAVSGIQWSDYRDRNPQWVSDAQAKIFQLFIDGKIDAHVTKILPLSQYAQALTMLQQGKTRGNIVLVTNEA